MMGLLIVGNGGQGKVVLECARACGIAEIAFLVNYDSPDVMGIRCYNEAKIDILALREVYPDIIVALGDNRIRLQKSLDYEKQGFRLQTLIHPMAFLSKSAEIGAGSVLLPFSAVNASAFLGKACIVNTGAIVEHDCVLGDGVHIAPRAAMGGRVTIGDRSWLGLGASVKNTVSIGKDCVIGVGAAVVKDIGDGVTAFGVPAKAEK